ncbi:MAG TPA: 4-hydroxy-tetrahydrodipicolinate reductase, partial [Acidimicrobiales bacterium]|nr:4-hydroxy-tetrahydrodipicolinate reductase [Acidimicrobiales bacterium]
MRIGVIGACGRMGSAACDALAADAELELVAAVAPGHAGAQAAGVEVSESLDALRDADVEVAVELTRTEPARQNLLWCAEAGIHVVSGTSGFTDADVDIFRAAFTQSNCLIAANFAIGAVLMMRFAELSAPWFDTAEIVELHHDAKRDAPSGTAMATASRMAAASSEWAADPTERLVLDGARGGEGPEGIRIHSVRLRGMVAHQEVLLGATGQSLTIRHDSYDRSSFMPGILLAVKQVAAHPGITLGLDSL